MSKKLIPALALLALTFAASAQAAERIAVAPVAGVNIHQGYLEASGEILKGHLLATGKYDAVLLPGETGTKEAPLDDLLARSKTAGAHYVAVTFLARLSGTGRLRMTVYKVDTGAIHWSDTMGVAGGPDDLDPALKRLAMGFASGKTSAQSTEIDSVTQREAEPYMKETATSVFGVRLGAYFVPNHFAAGSATVPGLGVYWLYDARSFLAGIDVDFATDSNSPAGVFNVGINGYLPFSRGNISPYIGGGAAWSVSSLAGGVSSSGLRLTGAVGLLLGRLTTVQPRVEVGYFANTFSEREQQPYIDYSGGTRPAPISVRNGNKVAHGPMVTFGLGF